VAQKDNGSTQAEMNLPRGITSFSVHRSSRRLFILFHTMHFLFVKALSLLPLLCLVIPADSEPHYPPPDASSFVWQVEEGGKLRVNHEYIVSKMLQVQEEGSAVFSFPMDQRDVVHCTLGPSSVISPAIAKAYPTIFALDGVCEDGSSSIVTFQTDRKGSFKSYASARFRCCSNILC